MLNIAVLTSGRAPGLRELLRHPARGVLFDVDCVVEAVPSPVPDREWREAPGHGVPLISHSIRDFYGSAPISERRLRRYYDARTAEMLFPLCLDAVVLLGYLYVITEPMLVLYPDRILNVHDSDLPRFPGLHATRDAVLAGEAETRSSVHIVTKALDRGPVIARSDAYPVAPFARQAAAANARDVVNAYAYAHREWMMRTSWANLVVDGLRTVCARESVYA
jgi:phosphoribosylglycinamide formyltransferase 1